LELLIPCSVEFTRRSVSFIFFPLAEHILTLVISALVNTGVGLFVFVIISAIGIAYSGAWYADYMPINTSTTYANTQSSYNVSKILTPDHKFDLAKYKAYSPLYLAPTFALNYGLSFAALTAVIIQIILFNGKEVWYRFKAARNQEPDIFMKLMKKYKEAPDWWYGALFVISMALGLATTLGYSTQLPCKLLARDEGTDIEEIC
jgi:hypothetical protein